ncbi:uncharacterized protein LOC100929144 [Sarcophilus harrisii]|uniref:Uncharacterized protein n=1 Tax=Sarcophilus harrisii TaxID=9305 RepID=A0A7N4NJ84_SARHA|nr:uncharacterized protein LOC100929144 [Sarcophilus harrisii]XP_031814714.1 uncharacterized protein LOC100929144 [Sarcophilus harrisii]
MRRRRILPNASVELSGNHRAKVDISPCSSYWTLPLNTQQHHCKPLMIPHLNQNQAKIKVLSHPGYKNTSAPSSCFKHQGSAIQLSHAKNSTVAVSLPHLGHQCPTKPTTTRSSCPKHWARNVIPSLPFSDSRVKTADVIDLPCSEKWITSPSSPDLWNKASLDQEHLPRISQGFDHWAENARHLNHWTTISSSPHYQNEVTSCRTCRSRAKTKSSLSLDYGTKATIIPFSSYNHQSKVSQSLKHYERSISSPLPLKIFSYRAKGTPLIYRDPCSKTSGESGRYHRESPLLYADRMIDSVQSRLKFNQCFKSPDAKHCIIHPLRSKSHETETKLLPDYQVSLKKLLLDPEYRDKFLLDSKKDTEIPLSLSYQSNDELEPDQNAKCLLTPTHHVKSTFDVDQQQIEDTIGSKAEVHFASDLNHKIKFRPSIDDCMKYDPRPEQQDEMSSDSDFLMKDKSDSGQEIKLPSKPTNWVIFPLDNNPRDISSQNSQIAPYSSLEQQSTSPLDNTQETSSPFLKQWLKPTQAPKYCTTHFTWPKHPDTPSSEFDFQQTSPLSFEHRQINTPIFDEQLESIRDSLSSAQGHSHLYHSAKAYPDKQGKAVSIPKYQNQAINNRESSWCFNYIRPYIIKGGTVHSRTVNSIISSIPQKEIKNDIRKQILLKRMKESSNHRFGSHLCASYNVCVLCASWIPDGCPHVDKMNGQTIAQLLAIPTPVPGSNTRMGIKFILQLPPQRTSPDIYSPHTNFGVPHHTHSSTIPSSFHSEFISHESPLLSSLGYNHARHQHSARRKASRSSELLLGEMSRRKEESVESVGIFKPFLERYHMKRRGN